LLMLSASWAMCALLVMRPGCPADRAAAVGLAFRPGRYRPAEARHGLSPQNDAQAGLATDRRRPAPRLWSQYGDYRPSRDARVAVDRPPLAADGRPALRPAAPDLIDWAIAAGCFAAFTVPVLLSAGSAHPPGTEAVFGAIAAAPLIVRRKWPVAVVLVVAAVYVAAALADVAFTPFVSNAGPNLAIAVFTAADRSRRPWSLAAAGVAGAATWASFPASAWSARPATASRRSARPGRSSRTWC
jgi:hypothetical protein